MSFLGTKALPEASYAGVPGDEGCYDLPSVRFHQPSTEFQDDVLHSLVVLLPPSGVLHNTMLPKVEVVLMKAVPWLSGLMLWWVMPEFHTRRETAQSERCM